MTVTVGFKGKKKCDSDCVGVKSGRKIVLSDCMGLKSCIKSIYE